MWYNSIHTVHCSGWWTLNRTFEDQLENIYIFNIEKTLRGSYSNEIRLATIHKNIKSFCRGRIFRSGGDDVDRDGRNEEERNGTILLNLCLQNALLPILY